MYTKEDILAQLRKGANAEDIANAMAKALNDAVYDYDCEKEAAEAEAQLKAKKEQEQKEDTKKLVEHMAEYFCKYNAMAEVTEEDKTYLVQMVMDMTNTIGTLKQSLVDSLIATKHATKAESEPDKPIVELKYTKSEPSDYLHYPHDFLTDDEVIKNFADLL